MAPNSHADESMSESSDEYHIDSLPIFTQRISPHLGARPAGSEERDRPQGMMIAYSTL